jgi:VWFA-related protein
VFVIAAMMPCASTGRTQSTAAPAAPQPEQAVQPQAGQEEPRAKIVLRKELVLVPVTVKDAAGQLVPDIRQDEFRIFEDDVEQDVEVYSNEAFPISAVVLIDNDLPKKAAREVDATLAAIAGGFSAEDEVSVCRFDHVFHEGPGFTGDNDKLLAELQRSSLDSHTDVPSPGGPFSLGPSINGQSPSGGPIDPGGGTAIAGKSTKAVDDAVYAAAQLLKDRGRARRKIIFLLSDGVNGRNNTYRFEDVVKVLLYGDISVYGVGVGSAVMNRGFTVLSKYAKATGGDVYYATQSEDLANLYAQVTEEARNQYTLAYSPRGTDRAKDYHSIEVRVERPGLTILTRRGYYTAAALHQPR